jgi:hypothetical protein
MRALLGDLCAECYPYPADGAIARPAKNRNMNEATRARLRRCRGADIGLVDPPDRPDGLPGEVLLASSAGRHATRYLLAVPEARLQGEALTRFLDRVAPFGCPPPPSLIRAYSLPDALFPSILIKEHEAAPDGAGEAYRRFVAGARRRWLAALEDTGPGLCPVVAWEASPMRRFLALSECAGDWEAAGVALPVGADDYLGRGLLLLSQPDLATGWPTAMSLGGVTKARPITGREFPVWVDLPAHQPALLRAVLLARATRLLAEA